MVDRSLWAEIISRDPHHSQSYIDRFRSMAAAGDDLDGEARLIDTMVPRNARVLDAGCGPGRVGGELARRGHQVVGVDVDPVLIAEAQGQHPAAMWLLADLAELDLRSSGVAGDFDVVVCAGNVMTFLAPSTRRAVLVGFANHVADHGRIVIGFGAGRGYAFDEFRSDVAAARLVIDLELSTWDLRPFRPESEFLVAVVRPG